MAVTFAKASAPRNAQRTGLTLFFGTAAVTGTGSLVTGLSALVGGPQATVGNAAGTVPSASASVTSVVGGTVSVVVVAQQAAANAVSGVAQNVNLSGAGS